MRFLLLSVLLLVGSCSNLYYPEVTDMTVHVKVKDQKGIDKVCGAGRRACAAKHKGTCFVFVPPRAGYLLEHELSHCFGRRDAPYR